MFSFFTASFRNKEQEEKEDKSIISECSVCMEYKRLHNFCDDHIFCKECINTWKDTSIFCPVCRKVCSNMKYKKYNYNLIDIDFDTFEELNYNKIELLFEAWHKNRCIKNNHHFYIMKERKKRRNKLVLYCTNCNIEEVFPYNS